jgi:hypothetical protein
VSKPFDATAKDLLEAGPADWLAFFGAPRPADRVTVIDADVSTVTAAADKVIRVADPEPWLLHVEFQADWDDALPARTRMYNAVLAARHGCPVASAVVLLRPAANAAAITGTLRSALPLGPASEFGYTVIRVWELAAAPFLTGPLTVAPMAVLAAGEAEVPDVVGRVSERVQAETSPGVGEQLLHSVVNLLLMRFDMLTVQGLMGRSQRVDEFIAFCEAGAERTHARKTLFRQGRKKFGPPSAEVETAINAISETPRLDELLERLLDVNSWDELLADGGPSAEVP